MNNIKIDYHEITNDDYNNNIFELREKIYKDLLDKVYEYIDYLYDKLLNINKIEIIEKRSIKSNINKESLSILYKGVEIPMMCDNNIILDNVEYIPIFQMVDKPVHLQKEGKYIVIKNNVRNTFLKLDGKCANVLYKNSHTPLLPYFLYIYKSIKDILIDFGYNILNLNSDVNVEELLLELESNNEDYYIVPEYYDNMFFIVKKDFEDRSWKEYFISPYSKDNFEFHQLVCNNIIDQINNNIIPQIFENDKESNLLLKDIKNESIIDKELAQKKALRKNVDEKNIREYILIPHKTDQVTIDKIFNIINAYHIETRTLKKNITKLYLETSLFKYTCKDITMNNTSVFSTIIDNIKNNNMIPDCYSITDISQKNIRFMEWYAMKLSAVRSYPEQNLIMEVAKTEQKRIYNNSVNPITELSMMSRVNLFGRGALPRESCQNNIRNLHDSYLGILDSADTPSGVNVGVSLHLIPEIFDIDIQKEILRLRNNNIINKLYNMQYIE